MLKLFQWLGGALFVAALGVCGWWYVAGVDRLGPPMGAAGLAADLALFGLFTVHHSVFARASVKDLVARALPEALVRPLYVWTASLLLLILCLFWQPIGGEVYRASGWRTFLHWGVQILGLAIVARAARVIDPLELAGIHQPSPADERLQVVGPYRIVRHPIYLGWVLATFGTAHMTGDRLLFSTIALIYLAVAVPFEERSLAAVFGREYADYRRRVRWRIVPFVY